MEGTCRTRETGSEQGFQLPELRPCMRFAISPAAPAATSRSASPPSTINGTGTDDGLEVFSCWATPDRPLSVCRPGEPVVGGGLEPLPASVLPGPLPPPPPPPPAVVVVVPLSPAPPVVSAGTGVFGV